MSAASTLAACKAECAQTKAARRALVLWEVYTLTRQRLCAGWDSCPNPAHRHPAEA